MPSNRAAWLVSPQAHPFEIRPSLYPKPSSSDLLIRVKAWAVNPIDQVLQANGSSLSYPWLKYPCVLGYDVSGEVIETGERVTRFQTGDRVFGLAYGCEKSEVEKSGSKEFPRSGFQEYVLLSEHMTTTVPEGLSYEQAAVLPLGLSTAACALFLPDQLGLQRPSLTPKSTGETVLIWGGSTSVGLNAIQLAVNAGYKVFTTCSPRNFDLAKKLGASQVWDYNSNTAVQDIVGAFKKKQCAGALTIGSGAAEKAFDILHHVEMAPGRKKFIAMVSYPMPDPMPTSLVLPRTIVHFMLWMVGAWWKKITRGIGYKFIWGGDLISNGLGEEIFGSFLGEALKTGKYAAYPEPMVVGQGLESLQHAVDVLAKGVSAKKVVVTA